MGFVYRRFSRRQGNYATFHQDCIHAHSEQDASNQSCILPTSRIELLLAALRSTWRWGPDGS
jgi:hypothetical protein